MGRVCGGLVFTVCVFTLETCLCSFTSQTQPSIQAALRSLESGGSDLAQGVTEDVCLSMMTLKLL